jgi:glyoxylase I family protein
MSSKSGPGFHHIAFRSFDFEKSVAFYEAGFGFSVFYTWGEAPRRAAMIDVGSGDYIEIFEGGKTPGETPEGVLFHFALRVPDCDKAFTKAVSAGAAIQMEPKDVPVKGTPEVLLRIAFIKGPDNEVIELFQNDYL